jgi:hypothetical protein
MGIQGVYIGSMIWEQLRRLVLGEARKYRGETDVRLQDLQKLVDAVASKAAGAPTKGEPLKPQGGAFDTDWQFNPEIWKNWRDRPGEAMVFASTDSKRDVPTVGAPQGGTVMKRNYGGRVFYQPGQARPPANDRLGSAMDRYDVIMVGDVTPTVRRNRRTGAEETIDVGSLRRVAYAPSIGSPDERRQRLEDLLAGRTPVATRRAQPEVPDGRDSGLPKAQPVPRVGQNIRLSKANPDEE